MGFGVHCLGKHSRIFEPLKKLVPAILGTKLLSNCYLGNPRCALLCPQVDQTVMLEAGEMTWRTVVNRRAGGAILQSLPVALRLSAPYVNFNRSNRKLRTCGDCKLNAPAEAKDGLQTSALRSSATSSLGRASVEQPIM